MRKDILFFFLGLFFCVITVGAQNWKTYYNIPTDVYVRGFDFPYLWYYSANGLSCRNIITHETITFNSLNSPITSDVSVIAFKGNTVWVGLRDGGIGVYDGTNWTSFPWTVYTQYQEGVSSIAFHPDGSTWVCGFHSISRFDGSTWKIFGLADGLPYVDNSNPVFHVLNIRITSTGIVWINAMERGWGFNNSTPSLIKYENNLFSLFSIQGHTNEVIQDFDLVNNNLVITTNGGTYEIQSNQVIQSYMRNGQPLVLLGDGVINPGGIQAGIGDYFWAGAGGLLQKVKLDGTITEFNSSSGFVAEESLNIFWMGDQGGLKRHSDSDNTFESIPVPFDVPNIPTFDFRNMVTDTSGNLWMGTTFNGLIQKSGETWQVYPGLPANSIIESLTADNHGNVWVGWYTYDANNNFIGGLAKITTDGSITHYNSSNSALPDNFINQLKFDNNGVLWASLGNGEGDQFFYKGLCKITLVNDNIANIMPIPAGPSGPSSAYPSDMEIDNNNVVWLSYRGHPAYANFAAVPALSKYDGSSWVHYNYQNSNLPSILVDALALDSNGNLFVLTDPWDSNTGAGASLVKFNGLSSTVMTLPPSWVGTYCYYKDLQIDLNNKIWISSTKGVAAYSQSSWVVYDAQNSPFPKVWDNSFDHAVFKIVLDNQGTKYFNCANGYSGKDGLVMYNENGFGSVLKQDQTIIFPDMDDVEFVSNLTIPLNAYSTSGLPITYIITEGNAAIIGNSILVYGPGKITVHATQAGDETFNAALEVANTFCINPFKPEISISLADPQIPLLTSSSASGNQWFKDDDAIANATNNTYSVVNTGGYSVKATIGGCTSAMSDMLMVVVTGIDEKNPTIKLYPNPTSNTLYVLGVDENTHSFILGADGKQINISSSKTNNTIEFDVRELVPGVYLIRFEGNGLATAIKFVKI